MNTSDRRPDENWHEYWLRKHDERHPLGRDCDCYWNVLHRR